MAGFREFVTGEVLTAANVNNFLMNQSVMVFADATARTSALSGALNEGKLTYNLDTPSLEVNDGTAIVAVGGAMKEKRIEAFTGSGNWTVPAGVTYAIAYMKGGGGGGGGQTVPGGTGGNSSVAFAGGTVTANGGVGGQESGSAADRASQIGTANSGIGGYGNGANARGQEGALITAAASVTPAAVIAVVVGAGGTAEANRGAVGGSGYVFIEYYEEV